MGKQIDVTKQKIKVDMVLQSQTEWEEIFNTITDMITVHDRDFNIINANRAAREKLGILSAARSFGKCYRYYHGTNEPLKGCQSCQCIKTKRPATFEIFEPHLNMHMEIRAIPRIDGKKQLKGLIHIVRDISRRRKAEQEIQSSQETLKRKTSELEDLNAALKVVLNMYEKNSEELKESILVNVRNLVMPYLEEIKRTLTQPDVLNCVTILEKNLKEIVSPLSNSLSSKYFGLSPKEIKVANLIVSGYQTKEIAKTMKLSVETVNCHRQSIRKKLSIKNKNINLSTYLGAMRNS
ncbi:MAG: PAS domain S-box protein [Nitrospiraceae bacterium]|nr:MAG: PAS domain S-box protein [Nitrospiraceae bacterium]